MCYGLRKVRSACDTLTVTGLQQSRGLEPRGGRQTRWRSNESVSTFGTRQGNGRSEKGSLGEAASLHVVLLGRRHLQALKFEWRGESASRQGMR